METCYYSLTDLYIHKYINMQLLNFILLEQDKDQSYFA